MAQRWPVASQKRQGAVYTARKGVCVQCTGVSFVYFNQRAACMLLRRYTGRTDQWLSA